MMRFLSPWWLLAILPVLVAAGAYVWAQFHRRTYAVRFTNVNMLSRLAPRGPGWRRHVAASLFLLTLLAMVIGVAQPAADVRVPMERATVIVSMDVSQSMQATDVQPNRMAAAKAAAKLFVDQLPASYNIGLVAFAKSASVKVSPVKDKNQVKAAIDALQMANSTAIGEGVFTSLDAITSVPADGAQGAPPARVVLLSDGFTNFGRSSEQAAAAAAKARVPVSTIAFGTQEATVNLDGQTVPVPVDRDSLRALAQGTKGQYYEAVTAEGLKQVYADLGSSIGYRTESREVTQWVVAVALLIGLATAAMSLLWTQRLP